MKIARKREAGEILRRAGLSAEVIKICKQVAEEQNYKKAMQAAGKIKVLCDAATYDRYWSEQVNRGVGDQQETFEYMIRVVYGGGSKFVNF